MQIDALPKPVFTDEGISIKPESLAARIGIGDSPETKVQNTRKVSAVNRYAKHEAILGRAE